VEYENVRTSAEMASKKTMKQQSFCRHMNREISGPIQSLGNKRLNGSRIFSTRSLALDSTQARELVPDMKVYPGRRQPVLCCHQFLFDTCLSVGRSRVGNTNSIRLRQRSTLEEKCEYS
jgi:hypothetical protein